jgi:hypothetical protein
MAGLPIVTTTTSSPSILYTTLPSQPTSHPILRVHIHNYITFQVNSAGEHFSKWGQIIIFLLTMHKAMDHITDGAAPAAPDDLWIAVDIHISRWFMGTLNDDLYCLVSGPEHK